MFIAVGRHSGHCVEILAYGLAQDTGACSMENTHFPLVELYGIVDEIGDSLDGLIGSHSPYVDFAFELQLALAECVGCCGAYK